MQFPAEFPAEFPRPMPFVGDPFAAAFRPGDIGGLIEPWGRASLSQDTAGATPVTAHGDPVGRAYSRFGGGYHPVQSTALSKPLYKVDGNGAGYLEVDGTNDFLATPSIPWGTDEVTVIAALYKSSDAAEGYVAHMGGYSSAGSWALAYPGNPAATRKVTWISCGASVVSIGDTSSTYAAPRYDVLIGRAKIGSDLSSLHANGTQIATSATDQGVAAAYTSQALYIGMRSGTQVPFAGRIYGLMWINRRLADAEALRIARRMNALARFTPW